MKITIISLLLGCTLNSCSQSEDFVGTYYLKVDSKNQVTQYHLTLNKDRTFLFRNYWKDATNISSSGSEFGKGEWKAKNRMVVFTTDPHRDINQEHRLDFNNSIARFYPKSSIIRSGKSKTSILEFKESNIFWLQGLKLQKKVE